MTAEREVPAMDAGQLARAAGGACVVDVRPATSHRAEHIAGARSIPLAQLQARLGELTPGEPVVFYCT